jgi:hypothetical protein
MGLSGSCEAKLAFRGGKFEILPFFDVERQDFNLAATVTRNQDFGS